MNYMYLRTQSGFGIICIEEHNLVLHDHLGKVKQSGRASSPIPFSQWFSNCEPQCLEKCSRAP